MLYFHWNLLSALLHLKIFAWIYWIGTWQTNEGTNRLTNIVTYRSSIGAKKIQANSFLRARVWSQNLFFGFYSYRLTYVIVFYNIKRSKSSLWRENVKFTLLIFRCSGWLYVIFKLSIHQHSLILCDCTKQPRNSFKNAICHYKESKNLNNFWFPLGILNWPIAI